MLTFLLSSIVVQAQLPTVRIQSTTFLTTSFYILFFNFFLTTYFLSLLDNYIFICSTVILLLLKFIVHTHILQLLIVHLTMLFLSSVFHLCTYISCFYNFSHCYQVIYIFISFAQILQIPCPYTISI